MSAVWLVNDLDDMTNKVTYKFQLSDGVKLCNQILITLQ